MAKTAIERHGISIRFACQCLSVSESCYYYEPKLSSENAEIADWLLRLTTAHKRWGFGLCFLYLRNVKGYGWDHKRVYRIYRELELKEKLKELPLEELIEMVNHQIEHKKILTFLVSLRHFFEKEKKKSCLARRLF